jgi:hypothetical protein
MAFAAAASVKLLHKLPRFDLWKFRAAPGIFDPSFSSESGRYGWCLVLCQGLLWRHRHFQQLNAFSFFRAYWGGIVSLALTIFIAGLAATCAFSAADCMSCCFRSRKQRPPDSVSVFSNSVGVCVVHALLFSYSIFLRPVAA